MKVRELCIIAGLCCALVCTALAQTAAPNSTPAQAVVPRLIRFSGVAQDESHHPMTGVVGITFALYNDQAGGNSLWQETQNVQVKANGRYTALLGSASVEGMPLELFSSGAAQWLGVRIEGQPEQARILLVSVPYALKAYEAETLSGRSASDFVLLNKTGSSSSNMAETPVASNPTSASSSVLPGTDGPTNFTGANATQIVTVTQNGVGLGLSATANTQSAVAGTITGKSNSAIYGLASNTSKGSNAAGVTGVSDTETGPGVSGYANGNGTGVSGVYGQSASANGDGVSGNATATSGYASGVYGHSASTSGSGVSGNATAASGYTSGVYGQSASVNGTGVYGSSANWVGVGGQGNTLGVWGDSATINGTGVAGYSDATTGSGDGIYGQSASTSGTGVSGNASATTGFANGVYGQSASTSGAGVSGNALATTGNAYGVTGSTATTGFGAGVAGSAFATTGNAYGVFGQSSGTSGNGVFGYASDPSGSTVGVVGYVESPRASAGQFVAHSGSGLILQGFSGSTQVFTVDASGNLDISGNLTVAGSKSARVKLEDGREVALYAVESPENWFEDFGTAQLQAGVTTVSFEPGFFQTVDTTADYHVFLTPNGDCRGLYIARKTHGGFEVREMGGGNSSIAFDYRIVARRRGFENVRLQDVHLPQGPKETPAKLASMRSSEHMVAPPPPRVMIPALPHPAAQAH